jgi:hypothetical protein
LPGIGPTSSSELPVATLICTWVIQQERLKTQLLKRQNAAERALPELLLLLLLSLDDMAAAAAKRLRWLVS